MGTWFDKIEEVSYSVVEYIPVLGTLYSATRAYAANTEGDNVKLWQSVVNFFQSGIRDVVVATATGEIAAVAIVHTMGESLTDKVIEVWKRDPEEKTKIKKGKFVLVANKNSPEEVFKGKAKGVHIFHGATFLGKISHPNNSAKREELRMDVPYGFYDGAPVTFSWKWTVDSEGKETKDEKTWGIIELWAGKSNLPTQFNMVKRKGLNGGEGYDFAGRIVNGDKIDVQVTVDGKFMNIGMSRKSGT